MTEIDEPVFTEPVDIVPNIKLPDGTSLVGWSRADAVAKFGEEAIPPERHRITKITLVNRVLAAGLGADVNEVFETSVTAKLQWGAAEWIWSDNQMVRDTLEYLGGDLDVLMAPE